MADLYELYWAAQSQIDGIVNNDPLLNQIIEQFGPDVTNVIVVDKQEIFAP